MMLRRLLPIVALTAVCALGTGMALAQNVFLPSNRDSDTTESAPSSPVFIPPSAPAPSVALPENGLALQTRPPETNTSQLGARGQIDLPDYTLPPEEAKTMVDHFGLDPKDADPIAELRAISPQEVAGMRDTFDAMARMNPELAYNNPLSMLEGMARAQRAEDALTDRLNAACQAGTIKAMISQTTFNGRPEAEANIPKHAADPLVSALSDMCRDPVGRTKVATGINMVTIVNKAGSAPKVNYSQGILTLVDDFARETAVTQSQLRSDIDRAMATAKPPEPIRNPPAGQPQSVPNRNR